MLQRRMDKRASLRILIADDNELIRRCFTELLDAEPDVMVVGEALDGEDAVAKTRQLHPDVVFMDIAMPRLDGIDATRRITAEVPGVHVIGFSIHCGEPWQTAMLHAGADACLCKGLDHDRVMAVVRRVDGRGSAAA